jgi:hypothetical protein
MSKLSDAVTILLGHVEQAKSAKEQSAILSDFGKRVHALSSFSTYPDALLLVDAIGDHFPATIEALANLDALATIISPATTLSEEGNAIATRVRAAVESMMFDDQEVTDAQSALSAWAEVAPKSTRGGSSSSGTRANKGNGKLGYLLVVHIPGKGPKSDSTGVNSARWNALGAWVGANGTRPGKDSDLYKSLTDALTRVVNGEQSVIFDFDGQTWRVDTEGRAQVSQPVPEPTTDATTEATAA